MTHLRINLKTISVNLGLGMCAICRHLVVPTISEHYLFRVMV